jgi:hypothetical protein
MLRTAVTVSIDDPDKRSASEVRLYAFASWDGDDLRKLPLSMRKQHLA